MDVHDLADSFPDTDFRGGPEPGSEEMTGRCARTGRRQGAPAPGSTRAGGGPSDALASVRDSRPRGRSSASLSLRHSRQTWIGAAAVGRSHRLDFGSRRVSPTGHAAFWTVCLLLLVNLQRL
jgi:hypothetical protein